MNMALDEAVSNGIAGFNQPSDHQVLRLEA